MIGLLEPSPPDGYIILFFKPNSKASYPIEGNFHQQTIQTISYVQMVFVIFHFLASRWILISLKTNTVNYPGRDFKIICLCRRLIRFLCFVDDLSTWIALHFAIGSVLPAIFIVSLKYNFFSTSFLWLAHLIYYRLRFLCVILCWKISHTSKWTEKTINVIYYIGINFGILRTIAFYMYNLKWYTIPSMVSRCLYAYWKFSTSILCDFDLEINSNDFGTTLINESLYHSTTNHRFANFD